MRVLKKFDMTLKCYTYNVLSDINFEFWRKVVWNTNFNRTSYIVTRLTIDVAFLNQFFMKWTFASSKLY